MADELSLALQYTYNKNLVAIQKNFNINVTVTGVPSTTCVLNVGTTDESLALGDVPATAPMGYLLLRNMDTSTVSPAPITNYILISDITISASAAPIRLKAGYSDGSVLPEVALMRWNGTAIHAKAFGTAQNLEYVLLPD
jgi:hypothetical protein